MRGSTPEAGASSAHQDLQLSAFGLVFPSPLCTTTSQYTKDPSALLQATAPPWRQLLAGRWPTPSRVTSARLGQGWLRTRRAALPSPLELHLPSLLSQGDHQIPTRGRASQSSSTAPQLPVDTPGMCVHLQSPPSLPWDRRLPPGSCLGRGATLPTPQPAALTPAILSGALQGQHPPTRELCPGITASGATENSAGSWHCRPGQDAPSPCPARPCQHLGPKALTPGVPLSCQFLPNKITVCIWSAFLPKPQAWRGHSSARLPRAWKTPDWEHRPLPSGQSGGAAAWENSRR